MSKLEQNVKVALRYSKSRKIPFGNLQSRAAVATILSFWGSKHQVSNLMQTLSHFTRIYFVNAKMLKGFLVNYGISTTLKREENRGLIKENFEPKGEPVAFAFHQFEMKDVYTQLETIQTEEEKLDFLGKRYPSLCVFVLKNLGMKRELHEYMEECK